MNYYVVYNNEVAIWVLEEEYKNLIKKGFKLYSVTDNENHANELCEKACYI